MDPDAFDVMIGLIVMALSLATLLLLVFWSRRRIERIARTESRSAREIARDMRSDR